MRYVSTRKKGLSEPLKELSCEQFQRQLMPWKGLVKRFHSGKILSQARDQDEKDMAILMKSGIQEKREEETEKNAIFW